MSSFYEGADPEVDSGGAQYYAWLAEQWAIKADGPIDGADYSAEYNASLAAASAAAADASAGQAAGAAQAAQAAADTLNTLILDDLVDVDVPAPTDGQVLAWNATSGLWEAADAVVAGGVNVNALIAQVTDLRDKLIAAGIIT